MLKLQWIEERCMCGFKDFNCVWLIAIIYKYVCVSNVHIMYYIIYHICENNFDKDKGSFLWNQIMASVVVFFLYIK